MSKGVDDGQGLTLDRHIPNIEQAARNVLDRLRVKHGDAFATHDLAKPADSPGGIPRDVFSRIIHSDFAIADISTQSPNVFYELAMLHANGVPVILLGKPAFYLNQDNCIEVADFRGDTLEAALAGGSFEDGGDPGQLEQLMVAPREQRFMNPITEYFGGVDLINVAASTGVATGNFYNFTRYVLKEGGVFFDEPDLIDLVLIRPARIRDVDRSIGLLQRKFGLPKLDHAGRPLLRSDGAPITDLPELVVDDKEHPRKKYFVKRVGNHLVDYPTPISSLSVSRQFIQMGEFIRQYSKGVSDADFPGFEARLIDVYFETLRDLANSPANNCDWGRVKILSVEDALDYLET